VTYAPSIPVRNLARELSISADTIRQMCVASGIDLGEGILTSAQAEIIRTHMSRDRTDLSAELDRMPAPVGEPAVMPTAMPAPSAPVDHIAPAAAPEPKAVDHIAPAAPEPKPVDHIAPAAPEPKAVDHIAPAVEVAIEPDQSAAETNTPFDSEVAYDTEPETDDVSFDDLADLQLEPSTNRPSSFFQIIQDHMTERTTMVRGDSNGLLTGIAEEWRPKWFRIFLTLGLLAGAVVMIIVSGGNKTEDANLVAGECYQQLVLGDLNSLAPVTCSDSHDFELIGLTQFPTTGLAPYPDLETFDQFGEPLCSGQFESHTGRRVDESRLTISVAPPSPDAWISGGDRTLRCLVSDPAGPRVGGLNVGSA
jgi:hypothetical protein